MPATLADLDDFHQFAASQVQDASRSLEFKEWLRQREREEVNTFIRQGMRDIEAGLGRPAREVMDELRIPSGFPARSIDR